MQMYTTIMTYLEETETQEAPYQVRPDTALTSTQIQEIERQKQELLTDLANQKNLRDSLNIFGIKAGIYAVSRALLLLGGDIGIYFCFTALLASLVKDTKGFLEDDSIQYDGGLKINSMNKIIKFLISAGACFFFAYNTVGDYMGLVKMSNDAYKIIDEKIEKFNTPVAKNEDWKVILGVIVGGGLVIIASKSNEGGQK